MVDTVNLEQFISAASGHGPCVGILHDTTLPLLAHPIGFEVRIIDGASMKSRDAIYSAFADAWHFPPWFGRNMDAFDDFMCDLENMVTAATGRPQAPGYLTAIPNAHLILIEQLDLFSWFANSMTSYREYYRDELTPPAAFGLLLSAPIDQLPKVRQRWLSVGVQVAEVGTQDT
ncbi:barstar family protein [Mycobacterium sp. pR1184]|uniref:barstar family protein n=1 Tax=Mycobacterium sp. pR1184 TaxID=3238981 RepID=UPI00351B7E06